MSKRISKELAEKAIAKRKIKRLVFYAAWIVSALIIGTLIVFLCLLAGKFILSLPVWDSPIWDLGREEAAAPEATVRPPRETPPLWEPERPAPVKLTAESPEEEPEETVLETVMAIAPEDETGPGLRYLGRWQVYGYDTCEECCGKTDGLTASGTVAMVGRTVAANGLEFGTVLYISGIGERVVEDRGGMGHGVIDVLCADHAACYAITGEYDVYLVDVETRQINGETGGEI